LALIVTAPVFRLIPLKLHSQPFQFFATPAEMVGYTVANPSIFVYRILWLPIIRTEMRSRAAGSIAG